MAQVIRRHWQLALLHLVLLMGGTALLGYHFLKSPPKASAATDSENRSAERPAGPLDIKALVRIRILRDKLSLRTTDLAALGCTQAQARNILSALSAWISANASIWGQAELNCAKANRDLAAAQRLANLGPPDSVVLMTLPTLQQHLLATRAQFDQLLRSAGDGVSPILSTNQNRIWETAKANLELGTPERYRYVSGLTARTITPIELALRRGGNGDSELPSTAAQELSSAQKNVQINLQNVVAAEKTIIPPSNAIITR